MHGSLPDGAERPLPLTERGCRTRASIVDAAATLMYQRGVCATSLDDLLATAGSGNRSYITISPTKPTWSPR